jgi:hypothetical protein
MNETQGMTFPLALRQFASYGQIEIAVNQPINYVEC